MVDTGSIAEPYPGASSSVAATEACLERIERLDPVLHAFITVTADSAREAARRADAAAAAVGTAAAISAIKGSSSSPLKAPGSFR